MIVTLMRGSGAGRDDVAVLQQELTKGSDVVSMRFECFPVRGTGGGSIDPPGVPPSLSSYVKPAVAKNDRPLPPSQNSRGRTTARPYPGRSAHASSFTSTISCQ